MPRRAPLVSDGQLRSVAGTPGVAVGTTEWYAWLENNRSFSCETSSGLMTVRKERRPGGWYWYAYRRKRGILQRVYLGGSHNVTGERLNLAAQSLDAHPLPTKRRSAQAEAKEAQNSHRTRRSNILLTTKLCPPALRFNLVPRLRLMQRLDEGIERKLILVLAPAGYGKTTLLGAWQRYRREQRGQDLLVAWLSLDERDNDPTFFWQHVIAALETLQPGLGDDALALLAFTSGECIDDPH
ncbi:MAG: hypothetical protein JO031_04345 [Ktedonobacteraceae bacterium]|nr:hypothetical protein [Ktedonobacteraceae bacterium]